MAMKNLLTKNAVADILNGETVDNPILQVCAHKMVSSHNQPRCRVNISDGDNSTSTAMLASQLNDLVNSGEMNENSIVKITKYMVNNTMQGKKIIIILNLDILHSGADVKTKLGNPQPYDPSNPQSPSRTDQPRVPLGPRNVPNQMATTARPTAGVKQPPPGMPGVHPIVALTPYQNKWTICARVTNKSDIRTWSNSRGEGKLFSMDLLDESGEIRATAFKDECDKFYEMIEIGKVYYISQAQLKMANKQYSSLKNEYEMTFNSGTQLSLCTDEVELPQLQFDFVSLDQLESVNPGTSIDIIGICHKADDLSTITAKASGREIKKRDIHIVDDTNREVNLTFWGTYAEEFDGSLNPVIAVKSVKVSDFGGRSLSTMSSSTVQINPDIRESHKLRAWYDSTGGNIDSVKLSAARGSMSGFGQNFKTIGEAILEKLGTDQADFYSTKAVVSTLKKENCLYMACPSEACNKKVIDMNNGIFRCEKCNKEYDTFQWRLMLSCCLVDGTDCVWVTMFQEHAEALLGTTAAELGSLRENDSEAFDELFAKAAFKEVMVKLRVKMDTFNEETRLKTTAVAMSEFNATEYNKKLIEQITKNATTIRA